MIFFWIALWIIPVQILNPTQNQTLIFSELDSDSDSEPDS